ncbi:cytotoxin leucocidin [Cystobacter fuscus]|uniref:Cytotoxin leucocidin n=1 Tax=Cystobacter fuscus TaxID=43 RepID=A0A250J1N2_9BACT|nr:ETX/MTX2 family pore-forming toxin [Cystobacter fuscus]ATB37885.1 cytotoxin leucocidin [Cystobacter fuscus]
MAIINFSDFVQVWANNLAAKNGTFVKWICLDASKSELAQYQDKQISQTWGTATYDMKAQPTTAPSFVQSSDFNNQLDSAQNYNFTYSKATKDTYSWQVTSGIQVTTSAEIGVTVPDLFSAKVSVSNTLSMSSTQGTTSEEDQTWSIQENIAVPPRTHVTASAAVNEQKVTTSWTADVAIGGRAAVWFDGQISIPALGDGTHWLFFPTPDYIFRTYPQSVPAGYYLDAQGQLHFSASGTFTGVKGVQCTFDVRKADASPGADAASTVLMSKTFLAQKK